MAELKLVPEGNVKLDAFQPGCVSANPATDLEFVLMQQINKLIASAADSYSVGGGVVARIAQLHHGNAYNTLQNVQLMTYLKTLGWSECHKLSDVGAHSVHMNEEGRNVDVKVMIKNPDDLYRIISQQLLAWAASNGHKSVQESRSVSVKIPADRELVPVLPRLPSLRYDRRRIDLRARPVRLIAESVDMLEVRVDQAIVTNREMPAPVSVRTNYLTRREEKVMRAGIRAYFAVSHPSFNNYDTRSGPHVNALQSWGLPLGDMDRGDHVTNLVTGDRVKLYQINIRRDESLAGLKEDASVRQRLVSLGRAIYNVTLDLALDKMHIGIIPREIPFAREVVQLIKAELTKLPANAKTETSCRLMGALCLHPELFLKLAIENTIEQVFPRLRLLYVLLDKYQGIIHDRSESTAMAVESPIVSRRRSGYHLDDDPYHDIFPFMFRQIGVDCPEINYPFELDELSALAWYFEF